ncbi:uncharacterized protein [Triticum aestivum]|uniref:uncharacterized protein isoform X5 n=1 Tax=Triticum aestivum TaxID=4565 RepID=UPI001D0180D4|nr:uncharacterized protein LOC123091650 isoform X5 [Triticum aestivum]
MVPDQTLAKYRGRDQFFGKASVGHHPNSPLAPTPTRAPLLRSCPSHARSRPWLGFRAGQGSVFAAGAAPVDSDGSSPSPPSPPRAVPLPAGHEGQPGRIGLGLLCFRSVMDEEPLGRKGVYQPRSGARCAWSAATTFGPTTHGHFRDKLLHQNFAWRTSGTLGYIRSRRILCREHTRIEAAKPGRNRANTKEETYATYSRCDPSNTAVGGPSASARTSSALHRCCEPIHADSHRHATAVATCRFKIQPVLL